jgi:hypothetical protein
MVNGFKIICSNCGKEIILTDDNYINDDICFQVRSYDESDNYAVLECSCGNSVENI